MFTKKARFHKVQNTETKAETIWYFLGFPAHCCKTVHLKYCPLLAFQSITMQQRMLSLFEIFASTDICRRAVRQNVYGKAQKLLSLMIISVGFTLRNLGLTNAKMFTKNCISLDATDCQVALSLLLSNMMHIAPLGYPQFC